MFFSKKRPRCIQWMHEAKQLDIISVDSSSTRNDKIIIILIKITMIIILILTLKQIRTRILTLTLTITTLIRMITDRTGLHLVLLPLLTVIL